MATDYYQQNLQDIVGGMMPNINKQKKGMHDFLLANALRTGQSAASVAQGMRPFAEASGDAAAKAGIQAKRMATQQEQFDTQQANWQKSFDQGQANWQKAFAQRDEQQNFANMMAAYQETGAITPEMLDAFGYGDASRGGQRGVNRQLDILGIGGGGQDGQGGTFGSGNAFKGSHQFYTNKAASQFGGQTGLIYAR